MQKFIMRAAILGLSFAIAACSTTPSQIQRPPGFLPNYSLLKAVSSPSGTQIYVYKNPHANRADYHAAIIAPVSLYQKATKDGVTNAQIQTARSEINAGIKQIVSNKFQLTNQAGPGVFKLQVAITGASLQQDGFKPWNIIPISAAIKLASMATDTDAKKPVMVVELKITDSQTGTLLKEVVTTISGDNLKNKSNLSGEFSNLATKWVQQALKYSNNS